MELLQPTIIVNLVIAFLLGLLIGLKKEIERDEKKKKMMIGGFRTHAIISVLGAISGIFLINSYPIISGIITGGLVIAVLIYYAGGVFGKQAWGFTTEATTIFAHLVGILCILQPIPIQFIVALTVVVTFIIMRKDEIHSLTSSFSEREVKEFTLYAVISLVVLPFLPNRDFSLNDLGIGFLLTQISNDFLNRILQIEFINPFNTWFILALITGLNLFGYFLAKLFDYGKSLLVSSAIGGFFSSTTVSYNLAMKSKEHVDSEIRQDLVASYMIAGAASLIQHSFLIIPLSMLFFSKAYMMLLVMVIGYTIVAILIYKSTKHNHKHAKTDHDHILNIRSAVSFITILVIVVFTTKVVLLTFGDVIFLLTAFLAGMPGLDSIVISISQLVNGNQIDLDIAYIGFALAIFSNNLVKSALTFIYGSKRFALKTSFYMHIIFFIAAIIGYLVAFS